MLLFLLATAVLTNLADISSSLSSGRVGTRFSVEGTVLIPGRTRSNLFKVSDNRTSIDFRDTTSAATSRTLPIGSRIRISGLITTNENGYPAPHCTGISVLDSGREPAVPDVSALDMASGRFDNRLIRIHGTIREAFRDEIDPKYIYLSFEDGRDSFFASICDDRMSPDEIKALIGATVSATGVCSTSAGGTLRRFLGRMVTIDMTKGLTILDPAPKDPFDVPLVDNISVESPAEIIALHRRRLVGRVLAVRPGKDILLVDASGNFHTVRIDGDELPAYGETIEAAGTPETDLYHINLANAIWRPHAALDIREGPALEVSPSRILTDGKGNAKIHPPFHGRAIRLVGTVMDLPTRDSDPGVVTIKSDGFSVPIDIGANRLAFRDLEVGCLIAVDGICIVECENWRPAAPFPHATGITLVLRNPEDLRILKRPSRWTPQRLVLVVSALIVALIVILVWNRILQHVIDRKSRQLLRGQVAQIKAALRVDERTHLAVELHDALSQNLSGVACQIAATRGTLPDGADETARYLATAERMLLSCRTELRRCLWDLRGDTLEEANFTEAIRKTLAPVAIGVETIIRFNVPRSRLSDTTAHAVLCIIRELAANAIRHGKARALRIAGEFHDGTLSFSVRDDGGGFDPSACDGPTEGHFGLEGIRERIKRLGGTFRLESRPGAGTRAEVTLVSVQPTGEETVVP